MKEESMKSQTLKQLIKSLKCDYVTDYAMDENFPDDGRRGKVELLSVENEMTTDEILEMMKSEGYRSATIHESLIWAKDNWKDEYVVVLSSVFLGTNGRHYVLSLWRDGSDRYCQDSDSVDSDSVDSDGSDRDGRNVADRGIYLDQIYSGDWWSSHCLFAGVRESLETKKLDALILGRLESL